MDNGFYFLHASAHSKKQKSIEPEENTSEKYYSPIKMKSGATLMNATRKTEVKDDNNQTNMLSIQEAIEGESVEKDKYSMQEEVDPFAEEENVQS